MTSNQFLRQGIDGQSYLDFATFRKQPSDPTDDEKLIASFRIIMGGCVAYIADEEKHMTLESRARRRIERFINERKAPLETALTHCHSEGKNEIQRLLKLLPMGVDFATLNWNAIQDQWSWDAVYLAFRTVEDDFGLQHDEPNLLQDLNEACAEWKEIARYARQIAKRK